MYSLALPLTTPPAAIQKEWYGTRPEEPLTLNAWLKKVQPTTMLDTEEPVRVLGLRQVKTALLPGIQEDAPLPDLSQREADNSHMDGEEGDESTDYPNMVMSPPQQVRVVAVEEEEDLVGDEDSGGYYDSDPE